MIKVTDMLSQQSGVPSSIFTD